MKLFENGVGRPSNEIKQKRRIFIASIVAITALVLTVGGVLLSKSLNANDLKGATAKALALNCDSYYGSINPSGDLDTYEEFYCTTNLDGVKITAGGASTLEKGYKSSIVTTSNNRKIVLSYTDDLIDKYKNLHNAWKEVPVTITASKQGYKTVSKKVYIGKKGAFFDCTGRASVGEEIICEVNKPGVKITAGGANSLAEGYKSAIVSPENWTYGRENEYNVKFKYTDKLFTNYKNLIKKDSDGNEYVPVTISMPEAEYPKSRTISVYKNKLQFLYCDDSVYSEQEFTCSTYGSADAGAKITVGGANSLAKGYASSFIVTSDKDKIKIKYTDALFKNYKNLIKKDSNGKKYITAVISLTNPGYTTRKEKVKIYQRTSSTSNSSLLWLGCPETSVVGKQFTCVAENSGVNIVVGGANSLAPGYSSSFVTTSSDKTKSVKYTEALFTNYKNLIKKDSKGEYITAQIYASMPGFQNVVKNVKIYRKEPQASNTDPITLSCPASKKVDEAFMCTTNQAGVKIVVGGAKSLASGYSSSFVTTTSDKTKSIKYADRLFTDYKSIIKKDSNGEYINAMITASKSGYKAVTKNVKIYRKNSSINAGANQPNPNVNAGKGVNITLQSITTPSGLFANKKDKEFKVKLNSKGNKVKYYTYVICNTYSECTASGVWDNIKSKYGSGAVTSRKTAVVGFVDTLKIRTNSESKNGKSYYLRVATYDKDSASNMMHKAVFQINVNNSGQHSLKLLQDTVWFNNK